MGAHEGKPAKLVKFRPGKLTPADSDGAAPGGKHEKPKPNEDPKK
ncbi:hypothetical protein ACFY19_29980 [Streptosporangium saharense]